MCGSCSVDLPVGASVELYSGCTTKLVGSDRSGTTPEELFRTLSPGTYAVRVIGKTETSSSPYALKIRSLPASVSVLSTRTRIDGSTLRLVGEVYNNTTKLRHVDVTARLYNASGTLLATRKAAALISKVQRSGRAPYLIEGTIPTGFARATISISAPISTRSAPRGHR